MSSELAIKVRIKLFEKGMTMADLAKSLGISAPYLSDIIRGKKDGPKAIGHVKRIKVALDIKEENK
ncbi:MAG: helix-turn-helix domain-containing protein [Brochothrix thermosphacta]|uniref:helix-turn-helix domain-containing protein n=1 Tax=Brochothrix thermosphacta TaxID=2756 RepID=UPI003F8EC005